MTRVLVVDISSKVGALGGAQRVSGALFYDLRKKGFDTYYLGYPTDYIKEDGNAFLIQPSKQKAVKKNVERLGLGKINETTPVRAAYYLINSILGMRVHGIEDWLEKIKPDVVISNSVNDFLLLKAIKRHLGNAKIIFVEHANASGVYNGMFDKNILALTFGTGSPANLESAKKRFFHFFDGVVALNKEQYRSVRKYNMNTIIIHSSVLMNLKKFDSVKLDILRSSLNYTKQNKVILYLGRLADMQKNVSVLIKAFKKIDDQNLRLLIVGGGKSEETYRHLSRDDKRIAISGRVPEDLLEYYYRLADLYVLPSVWESFNATFIEAAYFGVPLLLSTKSINEDIVEQFDGRLYLFDPNNVWELEDKIKMFFKDKEQQQELLALSEDIAAAYSRENQISGYAKVIKQIVEKGSFSL